MASCLTQYRSNQPPIVVQLVDEVDDLVLYFLFNVDMNEYVTLTLKIYTNERAVFAK